MEAKPAKHLSEKEDKGGDVLARSVKRKATKR